MTAAERRIRMKNGLTPIAPGEPVLQNLSRATCGLEWLSPLHAANGPFYPVCNVVSRELLHAADGSRNGGKHREIMEIDRLGFGEN